MPSESATGAKIDAPFLLSASTSMELTAK
jgi:hypothetical protein